MSEHRIHLECNVPESFNVQAVAGMFDVPLSDKLTVDLEVEVPGVEEDWTIGAIVGPSGSGKSSVAKEVFGKHMVHENRWPKDKAVVDGLGEHSVKEITSVSQI